MLISWKTAWHPHRTCQRSISLFPSQSVLLLFMFPTSVTSAIICPESRHITVLLDFAVSCTPMTYLWQRPKTCTSSLSSDSLPQSLPPLSWPKSPSPNAWLATTTTITTATTTTTLLLMSYLLSCSLHNHSFKIAVVQNINLIMTFNCLKSFSDFPLYLG